MARPLLSLPIEPERVLLVGVRLRDQRREIVEDSLDELAQLAATAGAEVAGRVISHQRSFNPATLIGKGKAREIAEQAAAESIRTVLFDDDLAPAQGRNLAEITGCKVIDRAQLILDIFAQHAQSRAGQLQIELAQLQYLLPRLRGMWTHLERQQGGIGLRGPGEKQLELDRRRIEVRIGRIRDSLEEVRERRAEQRRGRRRHGWALLTLVGYTNAGKSTLINHLADAQVEADARLFATLDPTTRQIRLPNHQPALITDTVGFIRKLPHHLVESFKATLEEVVEADLLIHVIDAAHPGVEDQIRAVDQVLRELGAEAKPRISVLNKMDLPAAGAQATRLAPGLERPVAISALTGEGLDLFRAELADFLKSRTLRVRLRIPPTEGKLLAAIRSSGRVFQEKYEADGVALLEASLPGRLLGLCETYRMDKGEPSSTEALNEGGDLEKMEMPYPMAPRRVADIPSRQRPRELFERLGAERVSDEVLLALLLRCGMRGLNVVDLAHNLLLDYGSLTALSQAPVQELTKKKGIGPVKAQILRAALELGRRLGEESAPERPFIRTPEDAARVLRGRASARETEAFWVLLLDTKNRLRQTPVEISTGLLNASLAHPREVFKEAIRCLSAAVVLVHNHPSGDPAPSAEDIKITRQLVEAGRIVDIPVLDHIILGRSTESGGKDYYSLRESGAVSFEDKS